MFTLLREGGFPMLFLVALGLFTLGAAAHYARIPTQARLRQVVALAAATLATTVTATAADIAAVGHHAIEFVSDHPGMSLTAALLQGVGECMAPPILGFTLLSLIGLLVAAGLYRDPAQ